MKKIVVPSKEFFNEETSEFVTTKETTLCIEHSLLSISKWESIWHIPFLQKKPKTTEQAISYIECMTINGPIDKNVYSALSNQNLHDVQMYIDDPMTATTFSDIGGKKSNEVITSELIYYWMIALNIPFECQKWHINRLLTLIRVCNIKNSPPKKMSKQSVLSRNRALNEARRKRLGTKG